MFDSKKKTAAVACAALLSLGGGAYATAASTSSTDRTPLTGDIAEKAKSAALGKVPGGALVGIESEPGGGYHAHVQKSDGSHVAVILDKDFKVTAVENRPPGGGHGHGGPGGPFMDTAALAKSLGVSEAKLRDALQAARPDPADKRAEVAAAIAKSLNVSADDVQEVLDAQGVRRGGPLGRHGMRDRSALASALAKKFNVSTAKAQQALDAARPAPGERHDELAAALAKELGIEQSKVEEALEANRPAHPGPGRP